MRKHLLSVVLAVFALVAAACGRDAASGGRLEEAAVQPPQVGAGPTGEGALDAEAAAAAGFPPSDQMADPKAFAGELLARGDATGTWTVKWQFRDELGRDGGLFTVSRMESDEGPKLTMDGTVGQAGALVVSLRILDEGSGPKGCMKQDENPWVCERGIPSMAVEFLSLDGFSKLVAALPGVIAGETVSVRYVRMAGVPTACFSVEPQPLSTKTLGLDFTRGGSFCVSEDGVLMALEVADFSFRAFEYSLDADPASFTLPVAT